MSYLNVHNSKRTRSQYEVALCGRFYYACNFWFVPRWRHGAHSANGGMVFLQKLPSSCDSNTML